MFDSLLPTIEQGAEVYWRAKDGFWRAGRFIAFLGLFTARVRDDVTGRDHYVLTREIKTQG